MVKILQGDCLQVLKTLPDESVNCCVTSPPYWGLRDYGVDGQIGLERTPEEYVAKMVEVFREVRRVLRADGTLWLNLGDSYMANGSNKQVPQTKTHIGSGHAGPNRTVVDGLKPKDLVGVPWAVAKALRDPYYTGTIKRVEDRIWLAAMIDGEGCMFIHKRKAGQHNGQGYQRKNDSYGAGLEVANCHESIVLRCMEITGNGSICHQDKESRMKNRNQRLYRWNLRSNECRKVIQEVYPYLVGKQHEARLVLGCPSSGPDAEKAHASVIKLHNGFPADIDFPEPESLFQPGYYLRQDIIWNKNNPMPESVTDRCTKAHEYIFLMSKSQRYFYDSRAVQEQSAWPNGPNSPESIKSPYGQGFTRNANISPDRKALRSDIESRHRCGIVGGQTLQAEPNGFRNRRSVWTVSTAPFPGAHFATFPPKLIEPCILAGCPVGGTVLDPFGGSGTVGMVAENNGRNSILIELNPKYVDMARRRTAQHGIFC